MLSCVIAAVLVAGAAGVKLAGQSSPPAPVSTAAPRLAIETFPAGIREDVARAYRRVTLERDSAQAAGELAMLLHAHGQIAGAAEWYDYARQLAPASFDWAYGAGLAQMALGRQQDAVNALRQAVQLQPASIPARLKLADASFAAAEIDRSAAIYERLLADAPRLPQAQYGLGRVEAARGNDATAVKYYLAAIELFERYGAAHYALALAYRNLGDTAHAQAQLSRYEKYKMDAPPLPDPFLDRVDALKRTAERHLTAGVRFGTAGDIDAAIREHEEALAADPGLAQAHVHLITLYGRKGDFEAAERHYKAAVALNSHLADAHYNYGVLLAYRARLREAATAFRLALDVNPYHAPAHNNLGQLLEREERIEDAARHYQHAIENDPQYRVARFNLGRMLVALNRPAEAIDQFLQTLEPRDESTPTYLFALAAACVRKGDLDAARRYGLEAQRLAEQFGQHELAAKIARDLETLKR